MTLLLMGSPSYPRALWFQLGRKRDDPPGGLTRKNQVSGPSWAFIDGDLRARALLEPFGQILPR